MDCDTVAYMKRHRRKRSLLFFDSVPPNKYLVLVAKKCHISSSRVGELELGRLTIHMGLYRGETLISELELSRLTYRTKYIRTAEVLGHSTSNISVS
jgi:hypothetical protein